MVDKARPFESISGRSTFCPLLMEGKSTSSSLAQVALRKTAPIELENPTALVVAIATMAPTTPIAGIPKCRPHGFMSPLHPAYHHAAGIASAFDNIAPVSQHGCSHEYPCKGQSYRSWPAGLGEDDRLCDLAHRLAQAHPLDLDPSARFWLAELVLVQQDALGTIDQSARMLRATSMLGGRSLGLNGLAR